MIDDDQNDGSWAHPIFLWNEVKHLCARWVCVAFPQPLQLFLQ